VFFFNYVSRHFLSSCRLSFIFIFVFDVQNNEMIEEAGTDV